MFKRFRFKNRMEAGLVLARIRQGGTVSKAIAREAALAIVQGDEYPYLEENKEAAP